MALAQQRRNRVIESPFSASMFFDSPKAPGPPSKKNSILSAIGTVLMLLVSYLHSFTVVVVVAAIVPALICTPISLEHLPEGNADIVVSDLANCLAQLEEETQTRRLGRNFAHLFDHAFVIPELTSVTDGTKDNAWLQEDRKPISAVPPFYPPMFISDPRPTQVVNQCWRFKGKSGLLGIQLSQPTRITSVALDSLRVWGMLDDSSLFPSELSGQCAYGFSTKAAFNSKSLVKADDLFGLLLDFEYDPHIQPTFKSFVIPVGVVTTLACITSAFIDNYDWGNTQYINDSVISA
ncbi:hypothetical protein NP233_g10797 [Leucocoprinus birnbaumii]|uniref:SUN domain-containing protein n=1 Tax=Leucocoprinus birnbaumii TaxID=56174 RepID=A0AAD5YRJ1_9AGAR|nr:hypothetical protein NP233_g10797 [Leucocoprinus birnbaumii]